MNRLLRGAVLAAALALGGCSAVHVQPGPTDLNPDAGWALLPIMNYTQTPQAGLSAESILGSLARGGGIRGMRRYPAGLNAESLFEPAERDALEQALRWARDAGLRYGIAGSVDEWRYKVGVDGEPAVGITLQVIDIETGEVLWSATGSKSGWSREALSAVAHKLIAELIQPLSGVQTGSPLRR
jgi:hypothetical protein